MAKDDATQKETAKKAENLAAIDHQIEATEAALAERNQKELQARRKATNAKDYATRNAVEDATNALREGRKYSKAHYDAILRLGMGTVTVTLLIALAIIAALGINNLILSSKLAERPIYYTDEEGVTHRMKAVQKNDRTKYIRDQIDEYTGLVLTSLYTYTPEGQPRIDLMTNLVDPAIIEAMKAEYQGALQRIIGKKELRTINISYVDLKRYDVERGFALVQATGNMVLNNIQEAVAVPVTWDLLIELQPGLVSGPNVYGLVLKKCEANTPSAQ